MFSRFQAQFRLTQELAITLIEEIQEIADVPEDETRAIPFYIKVPFYINKCIKTKPF